MTLNPGAHDAVSLLDGLAEKLEGTASSVEEYVSCWRVLDPASSGMHSIEEIKRCNRHVVLWNAQREFAPLAEAIRSVWDAAMLQSQADREPLVDFVLTVTGKPCDGCLEARDEDGIRDRLIKRYALGRRGPHTGPDELRARAKEARELAGTLLGGTTGEPGGPEEPASGSDDPGSDVGSTQDPPKLNKRAIAVVKAIVKLSAKTGAAKAERVAMEVGISGDAVRMCFKRKLKPLGFTRRSRQEGGGYVPPPGGCNYQETP